MAPARSCRCFYAAAYILLLIVTCQAATCATTLEPSYDAPVLAQGWEAGLVAQGIESPRSIVMDRLGHLLVLQQDDGIYSLDLEDGGGTCVTVKSTNTVVYDAALNHGLQLSSDSHTLYASTNDVVYSWPYNAEAMTVGEKRTVITGMKGGGHETRTLLLSQKQPGWMVVSFGSNGNIDQAALNISTGHSQIKAFDIGALRDSSEPYDFVTDGILLGWGLRNSVAVAENWDGGLWSMENSADQLQRAGQDISATNPGEELNDHGKILQSATENNNQGGNYGYPNCYALWDPTIPNAGNLTVGSQFALGDGAGDAACEKDTVEPRLTFTSHMAPLDLKFTSDGATAFVSFHGSWNSPEPVGYKVAQISFERGQPVEPANSTTAAVDIFSNGDLSKCPRGCFRPAGLYIDEKDRVWMSSDSTGEIWVLSKANTTSTSDPASTESSSSTQPSTSEPSSGASRSTASIFLLVFTILAACVLH